MDEKPSNYQLILCTCPDQAAGRRLASALLEQKLAACINLIPTVQSLYYWQEQVHCESECLMLIKSHKKCYSALEAFIKQQHSYEVPEVIALSLAQGSSSYLKWMASCLQC